MIRRYAAAVLLGTATTFLLGCELFVIGGGGPRTVVIERNQKSAVGVVHLWKAELDSNNLPAVTELMRHASGRKYLAVERYELADDLERWRMIMSGKPITSTATDTLSPTSLVVRAKVDYIRDVTFSTVSQEGTWYVTSVK